MKVISRTVVAAALVLASTLAAVAPAAHADGTASPAAVSGLSPADIASAYGLTGGATGLSVGIVIPFHHPSLESDLAVYRTQFGLPACTVASGCLTVVSQRGGADLPTTTDADWALEESLDVDAVSAACPSCRILVVETDGSSLTSLGTGVNRAVTMGAAAVSNSWTSTESSNAATYSSTYFTHPGVPIFAATGDAGYTTPVMPASLPNVIAVGGTTLTRSASASPAAKARASSPDALLVSNGDATPAVTSDDLQHDQAVLAQLESDLQAATTSVTTLGAQADAADAAAAAAQTRLQQAQASTGTAGAQVDAATSSVLTVAPQLSLARTTLASVAGGSRTASAAVAAARTALAKATAAVRKDVRALKSAEAVVTVRTKADHRRRTAATAAALQHA